MTQPITAAKGQINLILEPLYPNQGMQSLLANALVTASMSLTTQPTTSAVQGARLVVWVMNAPQAGNMTFTLTGLDMSGNAVSEGPITVPAPSAAAQSAVVGKFEYVTTKVFASINTNGLTTTNGVSTGATISVFAVQAAKFLTPGVLKVKKKLEKFSPNEHRNLLDRDTKKIQTRNVVTIDSFEQTLYPENSLWAAYMLAGTVPTVSSMAGFSTTLLTTTLLSGGAVTLTTQPNPGSQLQLVISGSSATGTITITGTNHAGSAISEVITANAGGTNGNGTYTSVNSYWTITSIAYTGLTSGSAAVNGIGPKTLLAAALVSGSPFSLSTQPSGPGMPLIIQISNSPGATGSVAISGTNQYGVSVSETIICAASNAIYYSSNIYSAVVASGVVVTGLTGGKIAVSGLYGWQYVFLPQDAVYSANMEMFTGVDSFSCPWALFNELTLEFGMEKEAKLVSKGIAQDRLIIGDRTTTYLSSSRVTAIGQPLDLPQVGWQSLVYLDTSVATIGTTLFGDLLEGKITLKSPQDPKWTATNNQNFNRVNRGKRETMFDGKIDLTNVLQVEQRRQNLLQYMTFQLLGQAIGGGFSKYWQWSFPFRWEDFDEDSTPDKTNVEATLSATAEYDPNLGGAYKLTIVNQAAPTYVS